MKHKLLNVRRFFQREQAESGEMHRLPDRFVLRPRPQPQAASSPAHPYLDTAQAAEFLHTSRRTLERLRLVGGGPKYAKAGRKVLYRRDWLELWLESRCFASTSEARANGVR